MRRKKNPGLGTKLVWGAVVAAGAYGLSRVFKPKTAKASEKKPGGGSKLPDRPEPPGPPPPPEPKLPPPPEVPEEPGTQIVAEYHSPYAAAKISTEPGSTKYLITFTGLTSMLIEMRDTEQQARDAAIAGVWSYGLSPDMKKPSDPVGPFETIGFRHFGGIKRGSVWQRRPAGFFYVQTQHNGLYGHLPGVYDTAEQAEQALLSWLGS